MPNLTVIERSKSKLNTANLALMTLVEAEPGNRDLYDIHFVIQEVVEELKSLIEEG